jgi:CheY-like chemotaxis protein
MKKRILLVDDEPAFARIMKFMLEKTGLYEVFCETDACNALATARACHPDLILLDIVMPHMDGRSIGVQLQSDPELNTVPIIFLTALAGENEADAARTGLIMGVGHHILGKLTKEADLLKCIAQTIEQQATARSASR